MNLLEFMPAFYQESPEVVDLQEALGGQLALVIAAKEDLFKQFTLDTATWGLKAWEQAYGLEVAINKPYQERRARIMSKMRSTSTTTKAMIKNVAESFSNGEVMVVESPADYGFEIKFTGTIGMPPNLADLELAVEELKPAHLACTFTIIYRTHQVLTAYTHQELSGFTHEEIRSGRLDHEG